MKYPKLHIDNEAQELYTQAKDVYAIAEYLNIREKEWIVWEMCWGAGDMARALNEAGCMVCGDPEMDCFKDEPGEYDCIITNPPFRNNKDFLQRAIDSKKPFAMILRLEHLGGVRAYDLLNNFDFQIIIPKRRITFITPEMRKGGKDVGSPFHSIWITHGFNLPKQINYLDI